MPREPSEPPSSASQTGSNSKSERIIVATNLSEDVVDRVGRVCELIEGDRVLLSVLADAGVKVAPPDAPSFVPTQASLLLIVEGLSRETFDEYKERFSNLELRWVRSVAELEANVRAAAMQQASMLGQRRRVFVIAETVQVKEPLRASQPDMSVSGNAPSTLVWSLISPSHSFSCSLERKRRRNCCRARI